MFKKFSKDKSPVLEVQKDVKSQEVIPIKKDYNYLNYPHIIQPLEKSTTNVKLKVPKTKG